MEKSVSKKLIDELHDLWKGGRLWNKGYRDMYVFQLWTNRKQTMECFVSSRTKDDITWGYNEINRLGIANYTVERERITKGKVLVYLKKL